MDIKIPEHIAFIMDGNGRWASKRLLPRKYGHREGVKAMQRVIEECAERGIHTVSFYAFSTENWGRPQDEVDALFGMVKKFADNELPKYAERNYRVRFMGDLAALPEDVRESIERASRTTLNNTGNVVNIGINYGGRDEIIRAARRVVEHGGELNIESVACELDTSGLKDPDVIVRSAGEKRLSNFMLWQSAYSELIFKDEYWPDFNGKTIDEIIEEYSRRNRRYGKVGNNA